MKVPGIVVLVVVAVVLGLADAFAASDTSDPETTKQPSEIAPSVPSAARIPVVDGKSLQTVLNSKSYIDELVRYLIGYETWIYICTDAEPQERVRTLVITEPVALPGVDGVPSPQWLEVIRIRGCERNYERMVYAAYKDGKPVFHAQIAGNSKTPPRLQQEAVTALRELESKIAHAAGCDRADRARVLSAELDENWAQASKDRWREVWTVHSCKGTKEVAVVFQSTEDGSVKFRFNSR